MTRVRDNNTEKIKCELCGNYYKSITNSHLKNKHNMTTLDYKQKFNNAQMISDKHRQILFDCVTSDEFKSLARELIKIQQKNPKRAINAMKATKSEKYRKNHSKVMKRVIRENPEKFTSIFNPPRGKNHHHYGKSNYQRWVENYGVEVAEQKLADWKSKNKIPGGSRNTKIELKVKEIFDNNNINYIHQYDEIKSYYVDFYLPDINLVFEVDGDYWHANPSKYKSGDTVKYPGGRIVSVNEVWDKDLKRKNDIISMGYSYESVYGSEITESLVMNKILKYY